MKCRWLIPRCWAMSRTFASRISTKDFQSCLNSGMFFQCVLPTSEECSLQNAEALSRIHSHAELCTQVLRRLSRKRFQVHMHIRQLTCRNTQETRRPPGLKCTPITCLGYRQTLVASTPPKTLHRKSFWSSKSVPCHRSPARPRPDSTPVPWFRSVRFAPFGAPARHRNTRSDQ